VSIDVPMASYCSNVRGLGSCFVTGSTNDGASGTYGHLSEASVRSGLGSGSFSSSSGLSFDSDSLDACVYGVIKCQGIGATLDVTCIPCAGGNAAVCAEEAVDAVAHVDSPSA
jgi:hypothetical protein